MHAALSDILRVALQHATILEPDAFEDFTAALRRHASFFHVGVTRAERPGYFRALAFSRGAGEAALAFRARLASTVDIYETVYRDRRVYVGGELDKGWGLERSAAQLGFGSYAIHPIPSPDGERVLAGLVIGCGEAAPASELPHELLAAVASALGASVERGLDLARHTRATRILETSGDALLAWDAEGRLTDLNAAAERLIGASRDELVGVGVHELFGSVPTGPSSGERLTLRARDGRTFTVAATVSPVAGDPLVLAHALLRDLSDVVSAEHDAAERLELLRELTEQHMVLLDNAPLLIFRLDPTSTELLYVNRHVEVMLGVAAAQALSTPQFLRDAHLESEGRDAFDEAIVVAKLGDVASPYEAHLSREGSDPVIARGSIYPIVNERGRVLGIEGILLDVTGERASRSRLVQADRLATVGMLAAGVAHEINNPAAFVQLGLDILARHVFGPQVTIAPELLPTMKQLVGDLRDTGRRIVDIARDMRTFASPPVASGRRALVDVTRAIESALTISRGPIVERADLEVDLHPDLPLVLVEEGRIGQVMVNLLVNAAHAVSEARAQRGARPGGDKVRVSTRVEDQAVIIVVEDTGVGMSPEVLKRVFTPFFTTKQSEVGTGLGLAISKTIIESAGGTIRAESPADLGQPPCGARFVVTLPAQVPGANPERVTG